MYERIPETAGERSSRRNLPSLAKALALFAVLGVASVAVLKSGGADSRRMALDQTSVTFPSAVPSSLPLGWEIRHTTSGTPFYYDAINDVTSWNPPKPVGYGTILQSPLFTQSSPPLIPPQTLVTNASPHKWGQFGIGPYASYASPTTVTLSGKGLDDKSISITVPPPLPLWDSDQVSSMFWCPLIFCYLQFLQSGYFSYLPTTW